MPTELNAEQRQAVETRSGPLLVLAGAGTGKTRVVTYRIAKLIKSGIPPDRILAVTFTKKAAAEMQSRVAERIGKRRKTRPQISTFHAHCVKVLRRHITRLGYPARYAIYDRGDQESVARSVLREIQVPGELLSPGDLLYQVGTWKTQSVSPRAAASVAETDKQHLAAMGYRRYQEALKAKGAVDFDDLLLCTGQLLKKFEDVRREEASRFDHLLIDEYQDTNGSQYRIVQALAQDHRNICVVGDDDQSIYGWRGAEVEHILRFQRDWPEATVVRLERNYRSTEAILERANALIAFNKHRHDKVLKAARPGGEKPRIEQYKDESTEAKQVVEDIARQLKDQRWEPRDFAILFRTNEQPRIFETELRKAQLPYVLIGGMSFFDRKEVRDMLAYLKTIAYPQDEVSLLRIINTPPRGISRAAVESLQKQAIQARQTVWDVIADGPLPDISRQAQQATLAFATLVRRYRARFEQEKPLAVVEALIAEVGYRDEIRRLYNDPAEQEARTNAIEEVINALAVYQSHQRKPSLTEFLDELAMGATDFDNEKEKQLGRNCIALMTLHSAKGLEFPHVYMIGMEEGLLPHHRSLGEDQAGVDEERRLCYVGITRAQERLTLSLALTRMKWGKPRDTKPSRFLFELIGRADNPHQMPTRPRTAAAAKSGRAGSKRSRRRK